MERVKFYKKIDQLAEHWYIDANAPVRGTYKTTKSNATGPRRKTNQSGEENEPNTTTGEVQIIKWARPEQMCVQCCRLVADKVEYINLPKRQIKCSCGLKYPVVNIETIS